MTYHSANQPVVCSHDTESFFERRFPVAGSHSFVQIVDNRQVGIMERTRFLHDADAPVEVGGKAIVQIVGLHQCVAGEESLMADQHSLLETFPGQCFRGGQPAHT